LSKHEKSNKQTLVQFFKEDVNSKCLTNFLNI